MISGRDIVVVGIQAWDIPIGSNCKNIAQEFSKHNRVLYVNPPMDRASMKREKGTDKINKRIAVKEGRSEDLVPLGDNFWNLYPKTLTESINWLPVHDLFKLLNKRNAKLLAKDIRSAMERLGFKDIILFNDSSMFLGLHLKSMLEAETYVYYMRDNLIKVPYWQKHGERIEPQVIKMADVVVNNSTLYAEYGARYNKHSYMVGQGCDVSLFNDAEGQIPLAEEMKSFQKPVLGYVGYLTSMRLDIPLLEYMAKSRPEWHIILVGPEDDDFKASQLHYIDNVFFLGSKDASELPSYVKGFDVAMNPQVVNDWTIGNYQEKLTNTSPWANRHWPRIPRRWRCSRTMCIWRVAKKHM